MSKAEILSIFTSKAGTYVIAIISSVIGTALGYLYSLIGRFAEQVPWIKEMLDGFWAKLTPEQQLAISPAAIGAAAATLAWIAIERWITRVYAQQGAKLQNRINAALPSYVEPLKVDRVPLDETFSKLERVIKE